MQSSIRDHSPATVLSSLVARQPDSDTVQLEATRLSVEVFVNGQSTKLEIGTSVMAWNVVISRRSSGVYRLSFSCGACIEIEGELDYLSAIVVSLPETLKTHTTGLLGYFNGDKKDDLWPMSRALPLPVNSAPADIHEVFGLSCELIIHFAATTLYTLLHHCCCIQEDTP